MKRIRTLMLALMLMIHLPTDAFGEESSAVRNQAQQRFQRGVELINQERWEEGLVEFEESYRVYPTQAALFNRALCLRLLRRYREAMDALVEYRARYASEVSPERMAEVDTELHTLERLIGRINVVLEGPSSAEIFVDGRQAGSAPTFRPLVVAPGRHDVEIRAVGFQTYRQTVTISSGDEMNVRAALVRLITDASIVLTVNVTGARVSLDGVEVGTTPLPGPMPATTGAHRIEVTRDGYERADVSVSVGQDESTNAEVILRPLSSLPPYLSGQVSVALSHDDAEVFIDGQPWAQEPLPIGPHRIEVRAEDTQSWSQDIEVNAGQVTQVQVDLQPYVGPPRTEGRERIQPLVVAGFASLGAGVALAAVGFGLYGWNAGRRSDWDAEDTTLRNLWTEFDRDPSSYDQSELSRRTDENNALGESLPTMDAVSWALAGVGLAALVASVPLLVIGFRGRPAQEGGVSFSPTRGGFVLSAGWNF